MNEIHSKNNDKLVFRFVLGISIAVFALVVSLNQKFIPAPETTPEFVKLLPLFNACINGTCSVLLLLSLYWILYVGYNALTLIIKRAVFSKEV